MNDNLNENCLFVNNGTIIQKGLKSLAKSGTLSISTSSELYLYNDTGEVIDNAPVNNVKFKFSSMLGDSVKMNSSKYSIFLAPPLDFSKGGGMVAGMEYAQREDVKAGNLKRDELIALVDKIQTK